MIPKYIVFNTNMPDKNGNALPVGQGNDLDELLSIYHGKAYQIMKVKTLSDRGGMVMTFDEVLDEMNADQEPSEAIRFMERLRDIYAPTIEMTQAQYDIFNSALAESKAYKNDFIYFIDALEIKSRFNGGIFKNELYAYRNDSRYLMQAWLHPETIKVVDNDV